MKEWHLSKNLTVGVIIAIIVQFSGLVWAASKLDSRVETIESWKTETAENRFTQGEADLWIFRVQQNEQNFNILDEKMDRAISKLDRIEAIIEDKYAMSSANNF